MDEFKKDPMTWSLPLGRWFGIRVRVSLVFLLFLVFQLLDRSAGFWNTLTWESILFLSVLLHEFGHCFAARAVGGSAEEILMWPLGGLAYVAAPNTARAQFITTVCGPLVNVGICLLTFAVIIGNGFIPPLNPLNPIALSPLPGNPIHHEQPTAWLIWVGITFGLNWIMVLFNVCIPAFPMDGGRMFRCLLWPHLGFARATQWAVQTAKVCAILMGFFGLFLIAKDTQSNLAGFSLLGIAAFVYYCSETERRMLEAGMLFDDSLFGYDFSEGYTSLSTTSAKSKPARPSFWERWWRRHQRRKELRARAAQQEQARQVDEILAKLHREGMASLTEQERRFLTRVSEQYRSRDEKTS